MPLLSADHVVQLAVCVVVAHGEAQHGRVDVGSEAGLGKRFAAAVGGDLEGLDINVRTCSLHCSGEQLSNALGQPLLIQCFQILSR